jgi:hypothetical protein
MEKITWSLILIFFGCLPSVAGQGIISQYMDQNGYFGRFGLNQISGQLLIGDERIQTDKLIIGIPGVPPAPAPTLRLNPLSGNVSIGSTVVDMGALTIRSHEESLSTRDLQFESNGNVGSEGSIFFQLDDDNNENASFRIKGSDFKNDLFFVGEHGSSFFNTDLTIFGKVIAENLRTSDIYTIGFSDVEVLDQYGDELYASINGYVYGDNDDAFSSPQLGAAVNLPHQATISKIEILFKDNLDDENFCVELFEMSNLSNTRTSLFNRCSTNSFASGSWQKWSNNVDVTRTRSRPSERRRLDVQWPSWSATPGPTSGDAPSPDTDTRARS